MKISGSILFREKLQEIEGEKKENFFVVISNKEKDTSILIDKLKTIDMNGGNNG